MKCIPHTSYYIRFEYYDIRLIVDYVRGSTIVLGVRTSVARLECHYVCEFNCLCVKDSKIKHGNACNGTPMGNRERKSKHKIEL